MRTWKDNLIFVDVEATGKSPASGVMTEFGAVHYTSRNTFHGILYDSEPSPGNPAIPVLIGDGGHHDRAKVMSDFAAWVDQISLAATSEYVRPVFVSDNNGYDAMWMTYTLDYHGIPNPFGHSSRRISDFYAGLQVNWRQTQGWKQWRRTPHTHNPVDDAMGNVEAFGTMLKQMGHR